MARRNWRVVALVALVLLATLCIGAGARSASAQTLIIDAPAGPDLPNLTPRFILRVVGLAAPVHPVRYTLFITRNSTGDSPFAEQAEVSSSNDSVSLFVGHLLPSGATIYWKARVTLSDGNIVESAISSARNVPVWLTLIKPNPNGDQFTTTRRPRFIWKSAPIDPEFGAWNYAIQILNGDAPEVSATTTATEFVPIDTLAANTPYSWQVQATVPSTGQGTTAKSLVSFYIFDSALPATTLLYQNFPNPFPGIGSFSTCFWFDVGVGGARIALDIVDLRGTLIKRIIPSEKFTTGRYGRGAEGSSNHCDDKYVWNGTATNGLTVPAGVYLARFTTNGKGVSTKKIVFLGR